MAENGAAGLSCGTLPDQPVGFPCGVLCRAARPKAVSYQSSLNNKNNNVFALSKGV
jgi:hypothetical protein